MADPIVIIGAGLAGLSAALELERAGEAALILDSAHHLGGALETSIVQDAYRLDRGFQVLLPAYPEFQKFDNFEFDLDLQYFNSGARLEMDRGPVLMANPLEHPLQVLSTALGRYGTLRDKLLVLKLQTQVRLMPPDRVLASASGSTLDYLREFGFSENMIAHFWRPFFAGIFLESDLVTAAGYFKYLVRMFASKPVAVPKLGVGELPRWLARKLKRSEVRLATKVTSVNDRTVELSDGQRIQARAVINSTSSVASNAQRFGQVTSFWFKSAEAPFEGAWLSLNSRAPGPQARINHLAVLSNVSRDYALKGDALICANVIGTDVNVERVLEEAVQTYGLTAKEWTLLREDRIARAFPLYIDRTDTDTPSQQGAMVRGKSAAREVLARW